MKKSQSHSKRKKRSSILDEYGIVPILKKELKPNQKPTEKDIAFIAVIPKCLGGNF